jgi:hypothetical protein
MIDMIDIRIDQDQDQGQEVIEDQIGVGIEVGKEVRIEAEVVDIEMIGIIWIIEKIVMIKMKSNINMEELKKLKEIIVMKIIIVELIIQKFIKEKN